MRPPPKPPSLPYALETRFGQIEDTFGPNARFRGLTILLGALMIAMGVPVVLIRVINGENYPGDSWADAFSVSMFGIGAVCTFVGMWLMRTSWVFICSRGLILKRGWNWNSAEWSEIDRFEDSTKTELGISTGHCRIVLRNGAEWRLLADPIPEYRRLAMTLVRKINEPSQPFDPGNGST